MYKNFLLAVFFLFAGLTKAWCGAGDILTVGSETFGISQSVTSGAGLTADLCREFAADWRLPTYLAPALIIFLLGLVGFISYRLRSQRVQANKVLRESEERWQFALEGTGDGIWDCNIQTGECNYSERWKAMLGYAEGDILPTVQEWQDRIHPEDKPSVGATMQAYLDGKLAAYVVESRIRCKDGGYKWILGRGMLVSRTPDGKPLRMVGTHTDISERKAAEESLRESEFLFRSQFELGNIGIAIVSPEKGWLRANPKLCQMLGYSEAELTRCKWTELSYPDDVIADKARFKRMLAGEFDSYEIGKRLIRKDGATIHTHLTMACYRNEGRVQFVVAGLLDITERRHAEEEMKLAALLYQHSNEAMTITDANGTILNVNPAFTRLTGYSIDEVIGKNPKILSSGQHDWLFYQRMWQAINATGHWQGEIWNKRKNGDIYAEWLSINTIFNEDGSVHRRVALFSDISEKKKSEELIWNQANFDFLTQLPNRRMFHDRLAQEVKKAARTKLTLALLFIDLDRFKEVNDTLGHDKGDILLKEASSRLSSCVRDTDTVARLGGDEFTVILGGLSDMTNVERIANHILEKLAEPFLLGEEVVYVSGSIGITFYPRDGKEIEALLKNADQAMYDAKRQGRNRFSYFTPAMQEAAQSQMRLTNELRNALIENQFRVFYQPIVELSSGDVRTAEALVRWQHPTLGLISPSEFMSVAEQTGLIGEIGDWVFREAASQAARWRISYYSEFRVSVNKSAVQFHTQGSDHSAWFSHLTKLGMPAHSMVMEITQGLLLDANTDITEQLHELRDAGMQISLDDFGAGHSTPAFLNQFKIDYIKIDQSFVARLSPDSDDLSICEAIISMSHKLGMKVIAEGVETEGQRDFLVKAGCDFGQGYLFSKPVSADEFEKMIFPKHGLLSANAAKWAKKGRHTSQSMDADAS